MTNQSRRTVREWERLPSAAAVSCIAVASLVPLAFLPSGFFIFLPIKWTIGLTLVTGGLACAVASGRFMGKALFPWALFLLAGVMATLASVDRMTSLIGSPQRNLGFIAWTLFAAAFYLGLSPSHHELRTILVSVCGASVAVSLYGLLQILHFDIIDWQTTLDVSRSRSTFGNAAFLGGYLVLVIPLAVRLGFDEPRTWLRFVLGAAAVLGTACLLTTQTRGAWVGGAVAIVTIAFLERKTIRQNAAMLRALVAAGGVVVVLMVSIAPLRARVASIADVSQGTAQGRLIQWWLASKLIAQRPVLGWGPDTFRTEFPRVITEEFEREVGRDVVPDRAHNAYLDVAAGFGMIGLLALLFLQFSILRLVIQERNAESVAIFGGLVGYLAQAMFSFPVVDVDLLFWLLAGLGVNVATQTRSDDRPARKRRQTEVPRSTPLSNTVGGAIGFLTLGALIWSSREVRADLLLGRALRIQSQEPIAAAFLIDRAARTAPERIQFLQASARFQSKLGGARRSDDDFEKALATLESAQRRYPREGELLLDRGDLFLAWGEMNGVRAVTARAETAYRQLLKSDRFSSRALLKLGVALVAQGRLDEAEDVWRSTVTLAPRSATPHLNLGLLYEKIGRDRDAIIEFKEVLRRDPQNEAAKAGIQRLSL